MNNKYRILHLEDVASDAELVARELKGNNILFDILVVDSKEEYVKALNTFSPDIILSDHSLPAFNSIEAFKILKTQKLNIPFIIITATLTEEVAVTMVREGVDDYILKDRIKRLPYAVVNAVEKFRFEKERKQLIDQVYNKEAVSKELLSQLSTKVLLATKVGGIGIWEYLFTENKFIADDIMLLQFGLLPESFTNSYEELMQYVHPEDRDKVISTFQQSFINYADLDIEYRIIWKDGTVHYIKAFAVVQRNEVDKPTRLIGTNQDITERKSAESQKEFEKANNEALINSTEDAIWSVSKNFKLIAANNAFIKSIEYATGNIMQSGDDILTPEIYPADFLVLWKVFYETALQGKSFKQEIQIPALNNGIEIWLEVNFNPIYTDDNVVAIACYSRNITEAKAAAEKIKESEARLAEAQEVAKIGSWETNLQTFEVIWSKETQRIFGNKNFEAIISHEKFLEFTHPLDKEKVDKAFIESIPKTSINALVHRIITPDNIVKDVEERWHIVNDGTGKPLRAIGTVQDITERKKADDKIKESELRYRSLIEQATDAICIADVSMKFIEMNPYACELFGYTMEEAVKLSLQDIIFKEDLVANPIKVEEVALGITVRNERRLKRKDGTEVDMEVSTKLMQDGRLIMFGHDITERKTAEKLLEAAYNEKNTILESISDAFFSVDKNWVVTIWNKEAERVLMKPRNEIMGHHLWQVFADSIDSASYKNYHVAVESHEPVRFEDYYPALNKWYEISAFPSDMGLSVYFKDVSERKISEIQLKELNLSLQKRSFELSVSNEELERFAYVASHDLQEPLRMVTSFLQLLQKKYDQQLDEKGQKYINFAVDGADRMKTLILDLLEFSRISSVKLQHTTINLNDVVKQTQQALKEVIDESGAVINLPILPHVCGNEFHLIQLFQNLISNAIKYKNHLKPVIEIGYTEIADHWQFFIKDNGIGIDEKFFEKIFIIFQRLHNKKEYKGTGIGLAICKKIVEQHGGKIWVESSKEPGTTFYFTINKKLTLHTGETEMVCEDNIGK